MNLNQLLADIAIVNVIGPTDINIKKVVFDSRKVTEGDLFVAVQGGIHDGHLFIDKAIEAGAKAVVYNTPIKNHLPEISYIQVTNSAEALGILSSNFFGNPSKKLRLVGITGTNGKTTTASLLHQLFSDLGYKCGLISTIVNKIGIQATPALFTTPDAIALNELLDEMVQNGCQYAFMEVSSHAIHQKRIEGLHFAGGVFTNITHDHLDYHKTFLNYLNAKKEFFDRLPAQAFALTNIDDRNGLVMVQNTKAKVYTFALNRLADFKGKILENSFGGLHLTLNDKEIFTRLIGSFNAYNLLAIYGAALLLEEPQDEVLIRVSNLTPAEGRFDYVTSKDGITAIIDYAHTPDALENVLKTIQDIKKEQARIITVVGCGGDRDREKRPKMAGIAVNKSHQVILTSDNPRSEDPESIIKDMEAGVSPNDEHKVLSIINRQQAIKTACTLAKSGDIILVAGKGHEKYQEINGVKFPFDDKMMVNEYLKLD